MTDSELDLVKTKLTSLATRILDVDVSDADLRRNTKDEIKSIGMKLGISLDSRYTKAKMISVLEESEEYKSVESRRKAYALGKAISS